MVKLIGFLVFATTIAQISASWSCSDPVNCPFNDLTLNEIQLTKSIILNSGLFPANIKFPTIRVQEPPKAQWINNEISNTFRQAYATLFNVETNILSEVTIDLNSGTILTITHEEDGISPPIMFEEYIQAEEIIRADSRYYEALQKRGLNPEYVKLDVWAPGPLNAEEVGPGKRLLRAIINYQDPKSRFLFWGVVEGLIITVDLASGTVHSIMDNADGIYPNVTSPIEELPDFANKPILKPLVISQPEGSSVAILGQQVEWYKWKFMYSVDPVFGLQLYHIRYEGDCSERSVIYKIAMAEMFVPYGEKKSNWRWRSAFDAGEYGIGKLANPLQIGLDLPENGILLNCTIGDDEPYEIPGCIGIYERDLGMLYKHSQGLDIDGRRSRVLVVTLMTTVANYDYTFDYIFHMDGTIEVKTRLTGILLARGVVNDENEPDCTGENCITNYLNDHLVGPVHQHWFNYRIDFDIDGVENFITESTIMNDPMDPIDNPYGSSFSSRKYLLTKETFRDYDFQTHRSWQVLNMNSRNNYGSPRSYAIKPETIGYSYITPNHPFANLAAFITHPIWFTKYSDNEQTCTYKFPRTPTPSKENEGLPKYIDNEEELMGTDSVTWYSFGVTHSTRAEEWPIMNIHTAGFSLLPYNFLSQNSEMSLKDRCP